MPLPVFVEFIGGTLGLEAGMARAAAMMKGMKLETEASMASVGKVGVGLSAVVAAGAVAVGVASVKMAGDFQQSVTKLATTAGESRDNLKMVGDGMLDMSGKVGIGANELAQGMYTVESAGFHGAEALNVMKASAQGSRQENASLSSVVDAVTTALHDYGLGADQAANVTSQLITATSHGKVSFEEFTGSLHSVTPIAAAAGISLADASGALAAMTQSGMSANQAADNLGATIKGLSNQTGPVRNELAALGLNAADLSANLGTKGVAGTVQEISDAIMSKMGPAGKTMLDALNQNKLAAADADKMFANLPPAVQKVAAAVREGSLSYAAYRKTGGGLAVEQRGLLEQWRTMQVQADGFSQVLKSGGNDAQTYIQALAKATGTQDGMSVALQLTRKNADEANATIKDIASSSAQADGNIKGWDDVQGNFNQRLADLHATASKLAIQLGTMLLPAVSKMADAFTSALNYLDSHRDVLAALATVIGVSLVVALAALSVALWTIVSNPIVLVITGIVLAIAGIGVVIYELVTHWTEIWAKIKSIAGEVADFLVRRWHEMLDTITGALDAVGAFFTDRWNSFTGTITGAMTSIHDAVTSAWGSVTSFLAQRWDSAWNTVKGALATAESFFSGVWNAVSGVTTRVFGAIAGFFARWWPLLLAIFAPPIFALLAIWHSFHDEAWALVQGVWNKITGYLEAAWSGIVGVAQSAWALVLQYIVDPVHAAWNEIVSVWDSVNNYLQGVLDSIVAFVADRWAFFTATVSSELHAVWDVIVSVWNSVTGFLEGVWNSVTSGVSSAWNSVYAAVANAINSVLGFLGSVGSSIVNAITSPISEAYNWVVNLAGQFFSVGAAMVNGIINGVENAAGSLFSSLGNLATGALDAAKHAIGVNSPSRLFRDEVGAPISEGIAVGITGSAHLVHGALAAVTRPQDFGVGSFAGGSARAGGGAGGLGGAAGATGGVHVHFHAPVYGGPSGMQQVAEVIRAELLRTKARNGGVVGLA